MQPNETHRFQAAVQRIKAAEIEISSAIHQALEKLDLPEEIFISSINVDSITINTIGNTKKDFIITSVKIDARLII